MATALQIQTLGLVPSVGKDSSHWLQTTATPRSEARNLFALIGRNGDTIESIRELIAVPPEIERTLCLYLRRHPEDSDGVVRVLEFRSRVAEEFEQLATRRKSAITIQEAAEAAIES